MGQSQLRPGEAEDAMGCENCARLEKEIAALKPVVEAAQEMMRNKPPDEFGWLDLLRAVDAYRAGEQP
jgi:hypothetical protein